MGKKAGLIIIIITFFLALMYGPADVAQAARKMPVFSLEHAVTGEKISSETFRGKSLLVVFFATWCPPCIQEIPNLIDLQRQYGENGFSVVAISVDSEGKKMVRRLVKKEKINYPVLMADREVTKGFGGVLGIPTSFLVNKKGTVVKKYPGYVAHSVLSKDISQVIR